MEVQQPQSNDLVLSIAYGVLTAKQVRPYFMTVGKLLSLS
ncbi:hypothetical protein VCRA2110O2_30193 [Vibrio crassostreae]|nr:hypothetical protein VCHA44O286_50183 [Vibrio chagasii]CAK2859393.1 hypothetical protein VCRA2110O2_30193 [Vibrio crassostreae]